MTSKKIINWGVIGPGKIAHKFVQDLLTLPNARLHAVASRSLERAQEFANQYDAPHAYGSYDELGNCPDLDVVYIATPHSEHAKNTILLLNKKIPVLCEKPMGINQQEVQQMISVARDQQTYLMEALWTRFLPAFQKLIAVIEAGRIGEVLTLKADFGFQADFDPKSRLFDPVLAGGALLDIGIYPAFLATLLLGKPNQIKAMAHVGSTGVDEANAILLKYPSGKMAILSSTILHESPTVAEIYGTKGKIIIPSRWHEAKTFTLIDANGEEEAFVFDYPQRGYHAEAAAVMADLTNNKQESNLWSLDKTLDLSILLDQIKIAFSA